MALVVRRNQAVLSTAEKRAYADAVWALKRSDPGGYDSFVRAHYDLFDSAVGHSGPAFLPWHREFLLRFEQGLQRFAPGMAVPYWDWTVDRDPWSSIWDADFLGGDGGDDADRTVPDGRFAADTGWKCLPLGIDRTRLSREFGLGEEALPTPAAVRDCLTRTPYDTAPWDGSSAGFRNAFEDIHNRVHNWVGGHMGPASSPNDPVFFLHHCNTDRLWSQWQAGHPGDGPPATGARPGHNLNDPMKPWGTTVRSVLDPGALGYVYDTQGPEPRGDQMLPGDTLLGGHNVVSQGGRFLLGYQTDGNLVLAPTDDTAHPVWNSRNRNRNDVGHCAMEADGHLRVRGRGEPGKETVYWASDNPDGTPGYRLTVWDQGFMTIHPPDSPGSPVWDSRKQPGP
ncbi:tyrosinase family protein [Streptomyces sp. NPDC092296]|uniref:tyrosinase family protein n=1 Tax=Streptomyces sp. NPDC092296 TaxID=3366012 RepID=UPI003822D72E